MKYKKTILTVAILVAALIMFATFTTTLSVSGSAIYGVDSMGNLITKDSIYQAFSLYEIGGQERECFVDDSRNAGCKVQETTLSVPAGAQIVHHISRASDYDPWNSQSGWEGYGSCAGFMAHYGCDPDDCAYHNNGVCEGSSSDSSDIECGTSSDCNDIGKNGYSCIYGKCWPSDFIESDHTYLCNRGQIYINRDGTWKMFGSCMDKYSVAKCADGETQVEGDVLRDICQADCTADSDCREGYACQKVKYSVGDSRTEEGGRCILESVKNDEDETFNRQEQILQELQVKAAECAIDGGEWTGTDCVFPDGSVQDDSMNETIEEIIGEEVVEDYLLVTCNDGTEIWFSDYEQGERCSSGITPNPSQTPGKKNYGDDSLTDIDLFNNWNWQKTAAIIGAVIIIAGAYIMAFKPFKKKSKKAKRGRRR